MDLLMTKLELAQLYGISRPTLSKRIAGLGFEKGRKKFSAVEVEQIMQYLGPPQQNRLTEHRKKTEVDNNGQDEHLNEEDQTLEEVLGLFEQLTSTDQELLLRLMRTWCAFRFTHQ